MAKATNTPNKPPVKPNAKNNFGSDKPVQKGRVDPPYEPSDLVIKEYMIQKGITDRNRAIKELKKAHT